jgi:hypothetical protein
MDLIIFLWNITGVSEDILLFRFPLQYDNSGLNHFATDPNEARSKKDLLLEGIVNRVFLST